MGNKFNDLPDIQSTTPEIKLPLKQVGVQNLQVPFMLESKFGGYNDMVAKVSIKTSLSSSVRGISMSRLLLTLNEFLRKPLKHFLIETILEAIAEALKTDYASIKFEFKLPIMKMSEISLNSFPLYYDCKFDGHFWKAVPKGELNFRFFQGVTVQYASYCPCSVELCKDLEEKGEQGFPHAQRSFAEVLVETRDPNYVWLEDIIELVEKAVKVVPYPIIKRVDEQEIARIASKNPMFVEDAIRAICKTLRTKPDIYDWIVKCTHEESIHTSEAIAINWKGVSNGFDEKYYI